MAYDASLQSGCSGTPKVCSPVADVPFQVGYETIATPPIVAGGRVYVGVGGGTHVFSLPT